MVTCRRFAPHRRPIGGGFALVELMFVVLIIGVLVTIAVPVFMRSRLDAESKACQSNQRTIMEAIEVARSSDVSFATASDGQLAEGTPGWYTILIPGWIKSKLTCPVGEGNYYLSAGGNILGDQGATMGFKDSHALP